MAIESGFNCDELTDFGEELVREANDFKKQTDQFMRNEAKTLCRRMIARAKKAYTSKTGNYFAGFKPGRKVYAWDDAQFNVRVYNSMPHAHLLEYGHRAVGHKPNRTYNGNFVPGEHVIENTAIGYANEFSQHIETKLAQKITKELEK